MDSSSCVDGLSAIQVSKLTKDYSGTIAVRNISFTVERGTIVGLRRKWCWENDDPINVAGCTRTHRGRDNHSGSQHVD